MDKITPFLWFDTQAEEAARFYVSIFPNSSLGAISHYGEGAPHMPAGTVMTVQFELDGRRFTALNSGPIFSFTEAISFSIACEDQAEIDHYWTKLTEGGQPGPCGWLKDRYGLSWQVVPKILPQLLEDADKARSQKAFDALMQMGKLDIAVLQAAHDS